MEHTVILAHLINRQLTSGSDGRHSAAVLRRADGGADGPHVALHGDRGGRASQDHRGRQGLRRHLCR